MTAPELIVLDDKGGVIERVAEDTRQVLAEVLATQREAHLVLTGGTVGIGVLTQLGNSDNGSVDWSRVHLWWGDERWLAEADAERNDEQARTGFLEKLAFSASNVHRMPASTSGLSLDEAARWYAQQLAQFAPDGDLPRFDLIFLGVGPDAHVASLFPGHPAGAESMSSVIAVNNSPKPPPERLSLTLRALTSAARVWLVAAGVDKAEAISQACGASDFAKAPASAARGSRATRIYCDRAAVQTTT